MKISGRGDSVFYIAPRGAPRLRASVGLASAGFLRRGGWSMMDRGEMPYYCSKSGESGAGLEWVPSGMPLSAKYRTNNCLSCSDLS